MVNWQILTQFQLFKDCQEQDLQNICNYINTSYYKKFEEIYKQGDTVDKVFLIQKGEVELQMEIEEEVKYFRLTILLAGEVFGIGELFLDAYYISSLSLTNTILLEINKQDFIDHFLSLHPINQEVIRDYNNMIRILIHKVVKGAGINELILYLYHICKRAGSIKNDEIHITEKQFQPQIASILHMSREHITRLFKSLKDQGVADFNHGYPIIQKQWLEDNIVDTDYADSIHYRHSLF